MPPHPTADPRPQDAPRRARIVDAPGPIELDGIPPAPAANPDPSRAATLLAAAELDHCLAALLLRLPPNRRQAAIRGDSRFRRLTLAQLFALRAESELHQPSSSSVETAELAAIIASELAADVGACDMPEPKLADTAALAHWLLGKALLERRLWRLAEESFHSVFVFVADRGPCEPQALACAGLAQLYLELDQLDTATALALSAADLFGQLDAARPAAACLALLGLALHDAGDLFNAVHALRKSLRLLGDPAFAPSLAARLHLALAEISTHLGRSTAAGAYLERARRLYPLSSSLPEGTERTWREARIAAAAGHPEAADPLFDRARRALLAQGSLGEATRCTLDHLLLRIDCGRPDSIPDLTAALADAFQPAGQGWAQDLALVARFPATRAPERYAAVHRLRLRLRQEPRGDAKRPPLLIPARVLIDRLLRWRGEHEDPIGAATGL
jgi:tetratricopeptide (TPR) repeat protein